MDGDATYQFEWRFGVVRSCGHEYRGSFGAVSGNVERLPQGCHRILWGESIVYIRAIDADKDRTGDCAIDTITVGVVVGIVWAIVLHGRNFWTEVFTAVVHVTIEVVVLLVATDELASHRGALAHAIFHNTGVATEKTVLGAVGKIDFTAVFRQRVAIVKTLHTAQNPALAVGTHGESIGAIGPVFRTTEVASATIFWIKTGRGFAIGRVVVTVAKELVAHASTARAVDANRRTIFDFTAVAANSAVVDVAGEVKALIDHAVAVVIEPVADLFSRGCAGVFTAIGVVVVDVVKSHHARTDAAVALFAGWRGVGRGACKAASPAVIDV